MPHNFDEYLEEDLSFVVRGETFRMTYVRPEALAQWEDQDEGDDDEDGGALGAIQRLDQRVLSFLHPDDRDRWTALRCREDDPVPFVQLREIVRWMVEVQSSRPTQTPSASASGRGATGASSTARSRSRGATPAA